ncbi:hypothetical protein RM555_18505 [Micromonospora sp. DSM 115977]|uniref:Secreted protein n=1 Tax=Micromonospora reichwaldensis TaxID=3075516 RepID=A0ABU2WYH2_9ACTN|nr:hypothetical protein [Micromonospora sp. DSM 115977]MDT0530982.1 hypothetical protein [Micromonospora sp. DSM 115977]
MKKRRSAVAALLGISALFGTVVISPAPAQAATEWSMSNTSADVSGAWVHGSWRWGDNGRLYVEVKVKDTVANDRNAKARLMAYYRDGGTRYEELANDNGMNSTVSRTYNFASNVTRVEINECTDNSLSANICGRYSTIFYRS